MTRRNRDTSAPIILAHSFEIRVGMAHKRLSQVVEAMPHVALSGVVAGLDAVHGCPVASWGHIASYNWKATTDLL